LNPIEREEDVTKEQAAENDCDDDHAVLDEESFQALKESIEEDNKFFQWLVEHCHNVDSLVGICIQRREEFDAILQDYQENPTDLLAQEMAKAYNGVNSLCVIITKKYGSKGNSPSLYHPFTLYNELLELDITEEEWGDF
jgi:hypothetical protein